MQDILTNPQIIAIAVGIIGFTFALFLARNKRTRLIMAVSAGLFLGTLTLLITGQGGEGPANTTMRLTILISAVLAGTIFVNDRFNYPLVHYASLLVLLFFSVYVSGIFFPTEFYADLREGIALEILAGGFSTFLIFLTIDSFNDQDADDRHAELLARIDQLQAHLDSLDVQNKKTLHG